MKTIDEIIVIRVTTEQTEEGTIYPVTQVRRYEVEPDKSDKMLEAVVKAIEDEAIGGGIMIER